MKKLIREDCFAPLLAFTGDSFSCLLFRGTSASLSLVMVVVADGVSSSLAFSQTFSVTDNRMKKYSKPLEEKLFHRKIRTNNRGQEEKECVTNIGPWSGQNF